MAILQPEREDRLRGAWNTDPDTATDAQSRAAARTLAREVLTAQTIAEMPEEQFKTEDERYGAAAKMVELMTGEKDYDGRLWNGSRGFKTGAEYLRSVKETLTRGMGAAADPELQAWLRMSDEEKDSLVESQRGILSHVGEGAGDVASAAGELVRGVPRLSKDEYSSAPEDVRRASDAMGSVMWDAIPENQRSEYEAKVRDWRGGEWQRLKRRGEYEAKLRRKNALLYLPDMIKSLKSDEAKALAGELAQNPSEMPRDWTARLEKLPTRDIETLAQIRGMTREHVEGGFFNWLGDMAGGVYNGAHGILSGMGAQEAKIAAMAMGWDGERVNEMINRKHALWSAYAGWSSPVAQLSDEHGAVANFTIGLASAVPFIASMHLKGLGYAACATEMMSEADAQAAAAGIDTTNPAYVARSAVAGGLYAYMLKAVSPKFLGASANGAAEDVAMRTAFMKGVMSGVAKLDTLKVMSQRTASGALMMAMQQGIAAVNEDLNLGGDAWRDAAQRFTETFVSSIPDMLAFSAHGALEGHARASGGWRKMFTAEGRANRSQNLREAVENAFAVRTAVDGNARIDALRTNTALAQIAAMRRAWTEGGEKGLARLGFKPEEVAEAKDFFEAERKALGAAEKLGELERATDAESLEEIAEDAPLAERNAAARRFDEANGDYSRAVERLAETLRGKTADASGVVRDLEAVRNVWAQGNAVGAGKADGTDAGAAALVKAGFAPEDAAALSKAFGAERRGMYSPAATEALRGLYTRSTRGRVEATAALASAFGGRVRTVEGRTYIDLPMPDGGTGTLAVETVDLSQKFYGEAGSDPELARQVERATGGAVKADDWIRMDDAARRRAVKKHRLVDEGDFVVTDPADPSLHVSSGDAETVFGTIRIDPTADPGAAFHEAMHGFLRFCQETGFFDEADLKWLTDTYGKPQNAREQLNEEAAADGFRQYLAKRMAGAITDEPGPFRKLFGLIGRLRHLREARAATERLATNAEEALYDAFLAGRYQHIRDLNFAEPTAPKVEAGGETAAPQTGAPLDKSAPTEEKSVQPQNPKTQGESAAVDESGATSEKLVQPTAPRVVSFEALTPTGGKKVKGHYEIVPLAELLHSNKPGYPMELQQRDRKDNKGEEATREDHVANFEAGYLLADPKTDSGAMVVARRPGPDGKPQLVVVSGNGRTMVLEELANRHLYDRYRNRMKEWAAENGVENAVADADNPVLVRVVDELGGATLKELADLSNTNAIQQMNEEETARADADLVRSLDLARLYRPNMDGSANMAAGASDEFFRAFVHATGDTSLLNSDGTFTEALRMRARRALLAIACGQGARGRDVVKKLVEATDALGIDRQKDAAAAIAPHVAAAEARPEYAIGPDVSRAFADYIEFRENRDTGKKWGTLENYLKQGDMLDQRSEIAEAVMRLLDDPKGAPVLAETVRLYAEAAKGESDGLFGAARTRAEIWRDAEKAAPETIGARRYSIASTLSTGLESDADYVDSRGVRRVLRAVIGDAKYGRTKYAAKHCVDFGTATTGGFTLDEISRYEHDILNNGVKRFDKDAGRRTITWKSPEGVSFTVGTFIEGKGRKTREVINTVYTDRTQAQTRRLKEELTPPEGHVRSDDPTSHSVGAAPAVTTEALKSSRKPTPDSISQDGGSAQGGRSFNGVTPEQDAAYAEAVKRGDLETARRMEREVYERMGYSDDSSYQGTSAFNGAAPSRNAYFETKEERIDAAKREEFEDTSTLGDYRDGIDVNGLGFIVFDPRSERNADEKRKEAIRNIRGVLDSGAKTITMYRSVPADVKETQFRNGDWITPSRAYAEENAQIHGWGDKFRVIEQEVSVEDVWWDGNDIAEWGFDDGKGSVYKNTAANRKLTGPTYDDAGNLIPLSKRFNDWKNDARYSIAGRKGAENMGIKGAAEAEAMEKAGSDREDIWRKTGWWRGRDGKWRVEIPDVKRDAWHGDPEERHFTGGGEDFYRYKLTEMVRDNGLFDAYPSLKKIKVEFHKNMPANIGGNFNEATLTIKLPQACQVIADYAKYGLGDGKAAGPNERGIKTLVHEIQHAIQLFEGLAKGGSPTERVRPYALDDKTGHALSVFSEAVGMDPTNDRHLAIIANWAQKIASDQRGDDVPKRLTEKFETAAKEAGKTPQEFRDEIVRFCDSKTESPMGQYFKLEGEVEARNVQTRLGMTPEERAATPPWATEDVPADRQIVRYSIVSLAGRDVAVAETEPLTTREAQNEEKVREVLSGVIGQSFPQRGEIVPVTIDEKFADEFWGSNTSQKLRDKLDKLWRAKVSAVPILGDMLETTSLGPAEVAKHINANFKERAVFYRCPSEFGIKRHDGIAVYQCDLLILEMKDTGTRYIYDLVKMKKPTLTAKSSLDSDLVQRLYGSTNLTGESATSAPEGAPHNIPKPSDEIKADPEAFARRSVVARATEGEADEKESALVAFVAERALRHGPRPSAIKTVARLGLEMGLKMVDTKRIITKGEALAERVRGTVIEKAVRNGDVATATAMLARESDIDRLVAGAAGEGGKLVRSGEGKIKSILDREIEKTVRSFNAASLADVERDTGIDIAGEILANSPEKFDPKGAVKRSEVEAPTDGAADAEGSTSGDSSPGDGNLTDYEIARRQRVRKEAEERVAKMIATAKERSEAAKKEREEWEAKREERKRRAEEAAASGESGDGGGSSDSQTAFDQSGSPKLSTFADFKTPEEFAAFFRVWAEDRYKKEHGASTLGKHEEKRLFPEFYRKAVVRELQDLADKLLPPKGARATVNRWLGEIQPGVKPDTLERVSADVFAYINKNAIRESRTAQIQKFRNSLKPFVKGTEFDDLKLDADRRVTGWVEEAARYIRRVCNLSIRSINGEPSQLDQERERLQAILDRREKVYDDEGKNAADAPKFDMETRRALAKLQLLDKYGAMKRYMPGEIADLADEAMRWLQDEAGKLEAAWKDAREAEESIRAALVGGIVGPNGQKYKRAEGVKGWADKLFDSMNGMIRLRLQHLVRFADARSQQKARDAINRVVVMLGDGETAFARHLQDDRMAFHNALNTIFTDRATGRFDRRACADWLNRMTEAIPADLSRRLSTQGYADSMTYGQMLQLLVSLEQKSYAEAIKANGRDGQADLIRTFETVGPDGRRERVLTDKDIMFIDWLRSFYEAKRGMLSDVTKRMTGLPVDSPDPLYCPVKMYMGDQARGMHVDSSAAWDPIGAVFSRRMANVVRDFDESASILGQFFDRSAASANLVAWGERGSIIRGVFTDGAVQQSIRLAFGGGELTKILRQLEETFNGGENIKKAPGEIAAADKAMNWMTYLSLGYNPLSAAKQTTSFTVWANALPGGFKDLWRYMTDVDMATIRHIKESEEFKVRYGNEVGSGHDVASKGLFENPSENPVAAFFRKTSMGLLRKGDFLPGGWIAQGVFRDLYNRHLKEGMDADAADRLAMTETFNMLEETQQSGRTYNTSELAREHGRLGRLLVQFATSPLQQLQYETQAAREVWDLKRYRPTTPDADFEKRYAEAKGKLIRAAVINHVLLPAALHAVTSLYRLAMGYDPEWEQEGWHWTLLRDITLGQFSRVFFIGAISSVTTDALITGKPIRDVPALIPAEGVVKLLGNITVTARDVATLNYDRIQKDFDRLLKSTSITRTPYDVGRLLTGKAYAEREERREKRRQKK